MPVSSSIRQSSRRPLEGCRSEADNPRLRAERKTNEREGETQNMTRDGRLERDDLNACPHGCLNRVTELAIEAVRIQDGGPCQG